MQRVEIMQGRKSALVVVPVTIVNVNQISALDAPITRITSQAIFRI
jgi:hypothetical protein